MPKIDRQKTARAIKAFRERKKLSKAEMARRVEVSASHYLNLEAGRNAPSYRAALAFADMGLDLKKYITK